MKKFSKSTIFRVLFTLFLLVVVIPILLSHYNAQQGGRPILDEISEKSVPSIPAEDQRARFEYLEVGNFETKWTRDNVTLSIEFINQSELYYLKDIVFFVDFYDDPEAGQVVESVDLNIDSIAPGETYLFTDTLLRKENYLSVNLEIEAVTLALDE